MQPHRTPQVVGMHTVLAIAALFSGLAAPASAFSPSTKEELSLQLLLCDRNDWPDVGLCADVNIWDTSAITDMSGLFANAQIRGSPANLSGWNTSAVTTMARMFSSQDNFNADISGWDTSRVVDMREMFQYTDIFNGDLSRWDTSRVESLRSMFYVSSYNGDVSKWDTSKVLDMTYTFSNIRPGFNSDLSRWNTGKVTSMYATFWSTPYFNSDLSRWDVGSVTYFAYMFKEAPSFTSDLSRWDTSSAIWMNAMFDDASSFNSDLNRWDTSRVQAMWSMFADCSVFAGEIARWDVSKVTSMRSMFRSAVRFNGDISRWDVSSVTDITFMLLDVPSFNQDLRGWNVGSVTSSYRFVDDSWNGDVDGWRFSSQLQFSDSSWVGGAAVCSVETEAGTQAKLVSCVCRGGYNRCGGVCESGCPAQGYSGFSPQTKSELIQQIMSCDRADWPDDGDVCSDANNWDVSAITDMSNLFVDARLSNTPASLSGWDTSRVTTMAKMFYLRDDVNADISGWDTSSVIDMSQMFERTESFKGDLSRWDTSRVVTMKEMFSRSVFRGDISRWDTRNVQDMEKMFLEVPHFNSELSDWNTAKVKSMSFMFSRATRFNSDISRWDVRRVTSMSSMLQYLSNFNSDLSAWDTRRVQTMHGMFYASPRFNSDLSKWDVSQVRAMSAMFTRASRFSSDISKWNVGNVLTMRHMFLEAGQFNSDISEWDVSKVTDMREMLREIPSFNQDLRGWNVGAVRNLDRFLDDSWHGDLDGWKLSSSIATGTMWVGRAAVCLAEVKAGVKVLSCDCLDGYSRCGSVCDSGCPQPPPTVFSPSNKGKLVRQIMTCDSSGWPDNGVCGDVNNWDVSAVTDMSDLFVEAKATRSPDSLSGWDTSRVTTMARMFRERRNFNADISGWDTRRVTDMSQMFEITDSFKGDLSRWNTGRVVSMRNMFWRSSFQGDVSRWDTRKVEDMTEMFGRTTKFNGDLSRWNTRSATSMAGMFYRAEKFNRDLSRWNLGRVTTVEKMFEDAPLFNSDLSKWDVRNAVNMGSLFNKARSFNSDLAQWDVSRVQRMDALFRASGFAGDISGWDVGSATSMHSMFSGATFFNSNISSWDVRKVLDVSFMFNNVPYFNQDLRGWNVTSVRRFADVVDDSWHGDLDGWRMSPWLDEFDYFWFGGAVICMIRVEAVTATKMVVCECQPGFTRCGGSVSCRAVSTESSLKHSKWEYDEVAVTTAAMTATMSLMRAMPKLDQVHLQKQLYVPVGASERCWCVEWEQCFTLPFDASHGWCPHNGTYWNARDQACVPCPWNTFSLGYAAQCDPCPAGSFSNMGASTCVFCPAGEYLPRGGSDCIPDEDECAEETHRCDVLAECVNTAGSYSCVCPEGYRGDGRTCDDVDECARRTHSCELGCSNTAGSFTCGCGEGYQTSTGSWYEGLCTFADGSTPDVAFADTAMRPVVRDNSFSVSSSIRSGDVIFVCRVVFPSPARDGLLIEVGANGDGFWAGVLNGNFHIQGGLGNEAVVPGRSYDRTSYLIVPPGSFPADGKEHTVIIDYQLSDKGRVRLWLDRAFVAEGRRMTRSHGRWAGGNAAAYGQASSSGVVAGGITKGWGGAVVEDLLLYSNRAGVGECREQCVDLNECVLGTHACEAKTRCANTAGGYECECPAGFEHVIASNACSRLGGLHVPGSSKCFFVPTTQKLKFQEAEDQCQQYGGNLASIASAEEATVAFELFVSSGAVDSRGHMWIGLTDKVTNGEWLWTDGTESSYRNWRRGRPAFRTRDCAFMEKSGEWNNHGCNSRRMYLCAVQPCVNVDECATGVHSCNSNQACEDSPGGFVCKSSGGGSAVQVAAGCSAAGVSSLAALMYLRWRKQQAEAAAEAAKAKAEEGAEHAAEPQKPRLVMIREGRVEGEIVLEEAAEVVFGREKDPPHRLDHDSCSRAHASVQLRRTGGWLQLLITDLGTHNGSRIDGTELTSHQPTPLRNGQNITFGALPTVFLVAGLPSGVSREVSRTSMELQVMAAGEREAEAQGGSGTPSLRVTGDLGFHNREEAAASGVVTLCG